MPDDAPIDPRYEAQFQRGYQGDGPASSTPRPDSTEARAPYVAPLGRSRTGAAATPSNGPSASGRSASPTPRVAAAPPVTRVTAPAPAAHPVPAGQELRSRAEAAAWGTPVPHPDGDAESGAREAAVPSAVAARPERDIRRNPFLWAVLVVGVLLLLTGGLLYRDLGAQLSDAGTRSASSYLQLTFEQDAAPLSLALGIVAILAVALMYARDWQRR